jgi:hypothetical protein
MVQISRPEVAAVPKLVRSASSARDAARVATRRLPVMPGPFLPRPGGDLSAEQRQRGKCVPSFSPPSSVGEVRRGCSAADCRSQVVSASSSPTRCRRPPDRVSSKRASAAVGGGRPSAESSQARRTRRRPAGPVRPWGDLDAAELAERERRRARAASETRAGRRRSRGSKSSVRQPKQRCPSPRRMASRPGIVAATACAARPYRAAPTCLARPRYGRPPRRGRRHRVSPTRARPVALGVVRLEQLSGDVRSPPGPLPSQFASCAPMLRPVRPPRAMGASPTKYPLAVAAACQACR